MLEGSIARRYAKALLELAREEGLVDRIAEDLTRFTRHTDGEFAGVMSNPVFTHAERRASLDRIIPGLALNGLTVNFLRLLLDKDRFGALLDILREFRALADAEAGRVRATVTTASELSPRMRDQVAEALAVSTGKKVVLETKVDPSLLGGMVARVGSRVFDASLRSRLERLQIELVTPSQA